MFSLPSVLSVNLSSQVSTFLGEGQSLLRRNMRTAFKKSGMSKRSNGLPRGKKPPFWAVTIPS
jgi:hypothetical protein